MRIVTWQADGVWQVKRNLNARPWPWIIGRFDSTSTIKGDSG
jgi:hypothetical protein